MELFKDIAAIVGCILSVVSLITLLTKGGRTFIKSAFKRNAKEIIEENAKQASDIEEIKKTLKVVLEKVEVQEEVSKQVCRNIIKNIYYRYQKDKKLPLYERKTADYTYKIYTCEQLQGNSYVALLYEEICKWEIDTVSYQDLGED